MTTTIQLSKKYIAGDKVFDTVELREPRYNDVYMEGLGQPMDVSFASSGPVPIVHPQVVDAYLQRLIVEPGYDHILGISAVDALKLEKAVCGFF